MAPKVTSSSDRSKRKAKTTVTSDKGRKNRSSVSKAQVTRSGEGVRPGSAKVTQSRPTGSPRSGSARPQLPAAPSRPALPPGRQGGAIVPKPPQRPQLPPGRQGGSLTTTGNSKPENPRRTSARNRANAAASGSTGPNRVGQPAGSANRQYGANVVNDAVNRAVKETRKAAVAKWLGVVGTGAEILRTGANIINPNSESSQRISAAVGNVARAKAEADVARRSGRQSQPNSGRPSAERPRGVSTSWQGPNPPRRPATSPSPSPSPSSSSGRSSSGRSSGGSSSSSGGGGGGRTYSSSGSSSTTSTRSTSTPTAKPEASKAGGGGAYGADGKQLYMAHKKNNPLMKRTFGYQTGEGPKKKDGDKGPVSGVGPVANVDKYVAKIKQNRGQKSSDGGGGRAAMAGKSGLAAQGPNATSSKTLSLLKQIEEMKKRGMK